MKIIKWVVTIMVIIALATVVPNHSALAVSVTFYSFAMGWLI